MPSLRRQLELLRDEALDFLAHPEDRQRGDNTRRKLVRVMAEMCSLIQGAPLLGPTAPSSHQYNTRRMTSALGFRRYECWDEQITYDEDIPIAKTKSGESESDVGGREAEAIFLEAFSKTIALLDLAEPMKTDAGTGHAFQSMEAGQGLAEETLPAKPASLPKSDRKGRKPGPKPDYETATLVAEVVAREAPDGDWRSMLDRVCEALDGAGVPCPGTWRKRDPTYLTWSDCMEKHLVVEAIKYRLKIAKQAQKTPPETLP